MLIFEPLLMGAPWLSSKTDVDPFPGPEWYGHAFFENFIDDVDDFSAVRDVPIPSDFLVMRDISEAAFKQCLTEILGDTARSDWCGEMSDHFAAHLHLCGRRTTAAFLLKGPTNFTPMGLNHLGKNNDQIYRLAQTPAGLLMVQHCHEIQEPVRVPVATQVSVGRCAGSWISVRRCSKWASGPAVVSRWAATTATRFSCTCATRKPTR